jgi:hypothetical protein
MKAADHGAMDRALILAQLEEHPGRMAMGTLAALLELSILVTSRRVAELARDGEVLVHRPERGKGRVYVELA